MSRDYARGLVLGILLAALGFMFTRLSGSRLQGGTVPWLFEAQRKFFDKHGFELGANGSIKDGDGNLVTLDELALKRAAIVVNPADRRAAAPRRKTRRDRDVNEAIRKVGKARSVIQKR